MKIRDDGKEDHDHSQNIKFAKCIFIVLLNWSRRVNYLKFIWKGIPIIDCIVEISGKSSFDFCWLL